MLSALHQEASDLASQAGLLVRQSPENVKQLYAQAASLEERALTEIDPQETPRTYEALIVSAAALYLKGGLRDDAIRVATAGLSSDYTPAFAGLQLQEIIEAAKA